MTENHCPTTETLRALVDGSLSEAQMVVTQGHVDQCPDCQQRLESLVAGSESWDAAADHLRQPASAIDEAGFAEAMRRIKDEPSSFAEPHVGTKGVNLNDLLTPSDQPGSIGRLGPYEVTQLIGQGGMGVVVRAHDPSLHRIVAVKVLAPYLAHNPQARKRFVREAQAIAAVTHDHVITIHAIDESAEQPRIVMQFIAGRSLQQQIDAEGSLDLKEILRIGMQTASGLAAAHAQGLVHRDVKPSNILLENGIHRVKLTDFGLARAVDDASLTQSGVIAGTPQYMAPEQANGDAVDHRADLFSLGSVMYAMCVGHSPFRASTTMGVLKRVCNDPPRSIQDLNPDIPAWLSNIIMKLLAKKPEDRFQSAREVAELLERWLAHVQQPHTVEKPPLTPHTAPELVGPPLNSPSVATTNTDGWLTAIAIGFVFAVVIGGLSGVGRADEFAFLAFLGWVFALILIAIRKFINAKPTKGGNGQPSSFTSQLGSGLNSQRATSSSAAQWFIERFKSLGRLLSRLNPLKSPADQRLALVAVWFVIGAIDLFGSLMLSILVINDGAIRAPSRVLMIPAMTSMMMFAMGLWSLIVAWSIYRGCFLPFVRLSTFIGLVPFTPGSLLRTPVSILTLFWLHKPENVDSYKSPPWARS